MAKKKNQKAEAVTVHGPRMLCWWHGEDQVSHAIVWIEHVKLDLAMKPKAVHVLLTDGLLRVVHESHPAESIKYAQPTTANSTVHEWEANLRHKLMTNGGDNESFTYLGLERPKLDPGPPTAANADLTALYDRAARLLKVPVDELEERYKHLNNGLQAMNLRNRLRAKGHNV